MSYIFVNVTVILITFLVTFLIIFFCHVKTIDHEDNFFIFNISPTKKLSISDGEVQALHFLQDTSNDLHSLNKYPAVKKSFSQV